MFQEMMEIGVYQNKKMETKSSLLYRVVTH
jgi:hypothetical protein